MKNLLLVVDMLLACAIVLIVLIQRGDSGGALGIGGSSSGGLFSARGSANFLTRTTAALAALFFATSLALAYVSKQPQGSIIDRIEQEQQEGSASESAEDSLLDEPEADVPLAQ